MQERTVSCEEKMEGVALTRATLSATVIDIKKCIICHKSGNVSTTSSENERKRVLDAAEIRNDDVVSKRLKLVGQRETFVYHVTKECNKSYTPSSPSENNRDK